MSPVEVQHLHTSGHPVAFGRYSLAAFSEKLADEEFAGSKIFILADENTLEHCLPPLINKVAPLHEAEILEITSGEESKIIEVASQLWSVLGELGAERGSLIINLGGGVITDLGGFIAGTFKRGLRFFNIPTSLLAQVDASVGGKTGINHEGIKNQVGLFNHPLGVFIDPAFLETLPRNHVLSGFAEMVKHALISSAEYWSELKKVSLLQLDSLDQAIMQSVRIKNKIVEADPREKGERKLLNFGHTVGHAVETFSIESDMKALLHGEAIALGMVCESFISHKLSGLDEEELQAITAFIFSHFAKAELEELHYHRIIELIKHDKKNNGGEVQMVLLKQIGTAEFDKVITADIIIESLNYYKRWVR